MMVFVPGPPGTDALIIFNDYIFLGTTTFEGNWEPVWRRSLSDITGMEKLKGTSGFTIYPNPASDKIMVKINDFSRETRVSIFDIRVNQILDRSFINKQSIELDVSNLSNGLYVMKVQTDQGTETKKLVKQ